MTHGEVSWDGLNTGMIDRMMQQDSHFLSLLNGGRQSLLDAFPTAEGSCRLTLPLLDKP